MTRAVMYLRVSLDRTGEQLAVTRQREDCRKIAAARGWEIVEEYVDNSISAYDSEKVRPAYNQMEQDYQDGKFDALLCWDLDRLTRQIGQLSTWIERSQKRGLQIVTANGEADLQTNSGRLFASIKVAVARSEMEQKSARQKRAARQRAEQGKFPMGRKPYGYNPDGTVNPEQAETVRFIFERFIAGEPIKGIMRLLTERGSVATGGKPWGSTSVRKMLANPVYAGRCYYLGEYVARGAWEPLISEERFDAVQATLSDPRRKSHHTGYASRYLGTGLYRCGKCGKTVRTERSKGTSRYRCCFQRKTEAIDDYVLLVMERRLAAPDLSRVLSRPQDETQMQELRAEREKLQGRMRQFENDYDEGLIDGRRYREAMDKATASLEPIQRAMNRLAGGTEGAEVLTAEDPVQAFDDATIAMKRAAIRALMTVTLLRGISGQTRFDPATVDIAWNHGD